ncbi:MAG: NAD(P)-dependent oxidoreductase [Clostridia bacterium]|nr:NAD(P)-dependent oxidoreductase [Clostridia bacterium]
MNTAIVTGSTGMLGIALINKLLEENVRVVAVARPGSSRIANIPSDERVTVIEIALKDIINLPVALKAKGITQADSFFHFGWDGTFGDARNNMDGQLINVKASVDAVRAAAELKCEVFLGAGSQAEYGRVADGIKLSAATPTNPENGYGIGKLCACHMTRVEAHKFGIRHIWTRILSVYGPYDGLHTMVMSGIGNLMDGLKASYTKGEQMWDYIYCKDAANAFYLAATKGKDGSVYPIGSGNVRPLKDYITDIRDAVNPSAELGFGEVDYYPGQVMYLCADISSLTEDTGFIPQYSFAEGIKETVEYYKNHIYTRQA